MGAAMDHRIDLFTFAEPDIEGDVGMAWRQACIMIVRLAICGAAAIRLQGDEQIASAHDREREYAVTSLRVWQAPMHAHRTDKVLRHGIKRRGIIGECQDFGWCRPFEV